MESSSLKQQSANGGDIDKLILKNFQEQYTKNVVNLILNNDLLENDEHYYEFVYRNYETLKKKISAAKKNQGVKNDDIFEYIEKSLDTSRKKIENMKNEIYSKMIFNKTDKEEKKKKFNALDHQPASFYSYIKGQWINNKPNFNRKREHDAKTYQQEKNMRVFNDYKEYLEKVSKNKSGERLDFDEEMRKMQHRRDMAIAEAKRLEALGEDEDFTKKYAQPEKEEKAGPIDIRGLRKYVRNMITKLVGIADTGNFSRKNLLVNYKTNTSENSDDDDRIFNLDYFHKKINNGPSAESKDDDAVFLNNHSLKTLYNGFKIAESYDKSKYKKKRLVNEILDNNVNRSYSQFGK